MSEPVKPCPFCGQTIVSVEEGISFRWAHAECVECRARGPEIRVKTLNRNEEVRKQDAYIRAIAEWNRRIEP